uniref:Alginate lyase domain-containing protein n=1 Tax=Kwoniella dejecticola CBS 10117 TaxID=1296121 RepID=A0A1A5ZXT4_9TREE|nr:uncharacterized protein I303_07383 [Kwoniella dejecticola CBS 10117]OBR82621.1 hypothetical protein I303_07383 [Kwoniella dejecticola CBS 10117]
MLTQQSTKTPLPIPDQPLDILLPLPKESTNAHTLTLLRELVEGILEKDVRYSVTFSPILCPVGKEEGGGKNKLFTIKPHWWQTQDGKWENAKPQGQAQLESLARSVHTLSLGLLYITDFEIRQKSIKRIEDLLRVFFVDPETRMEPEVRFSQCHPGEEPMKGNEGFVVAIRFLVLVDQALILCERFIDPGLIIQLASHHRLLDPANTSYATLALHDWINEHDSPQNTFEGVMKNDNRRHRCLETLQKLFIIADLTVPRSEHGTLSQEIKMYLKGCVEYVKMVEKGPVETPREDDVRHLARVAWFDKILDTWEGNVPAEGTGDEPDGQGWEGGWVKRMKMMWGFI